MAEGFVIVLRVYYSIVPVRRVFVRTLDVPMNWEIRI